jgi:hypothetical protein
MKLYSWLLVSTVLLSGLISHAAMTAVRFYHLGEADPGVVHTLVATNSLDSASTNALAITGAPKYWAHAAPGNTNSSFSMLFATGDQGTAAVVSDTNNVCIEAWASSAWRTTHVIVYNGNQSLDGYGIVLETNVYRAVLGGIGTVGTVPCPPGQWMHLALVCSNGTANFFTNGQLAATISATPKPPTGNLTVGGPSTGVNVVQGIFDYVQGFVDEVRISTFATGGFQPADLLWVPLPRIMAIKRDAANHIVISTPTIYSQVMLQETTNLPTTNWQTIAGPTVAGSPLVWTNSLQENSRFYRLIELAKTAPVMGLFFSQDGSIYDLDLYPLYSQDYFLDVYNIPIYRLINGVDATTPGVFDASTCLDSLSGTSNTLSFNWLLKKPIAAGGDIITPAGFTGFDSPVLHFSPNSLYTLPYNSDGVSDEYIMVLTIRHIPFSSGVQPPQDTAFGFRFQYVGGDLPPP